jgi:hypothetical protein
MMCNLGGVERAFMPAYKQDKEVTFAAEIVGLSGEGVRVVNHQDAGLKARSTKVAVFS